MRIFHAILISSTASGYNIDIYKLYMDYIHGRMRGLMAMTMMITLWSRLIALSSAAEPPSHDDEISLPPFPPLFVLHNHTHDLSPRLVPNPGKAYARKLGGRTKNSFYRRLL